MKPVASMLMLACLCACSPQGGSVPPSAGDAASPGTRAADAPADVAGKPVPAGPSSPAAGNAPAAAPEGARGIAVGEPHPTSTHTPPREGPARFDGYGDMLFGMDDAAARKAWNAPLKGEGAGTDACTYLRPLRASAPHFMFEGGRFVRYDVSSEDERAPGGGRVGLSGDDIARLYAGRVKVSPHHYVPGGHYLRIADPASADRALLFETDARGQVTGWRVGRIPQVDYVEGCA